MDDHDEIRRRTWGMTIWLVRHGCVGSGPDGGDEPTLDTAGREQAHAIADLLVHRRPTALHSSPARRCIETLSPLGALLGLAVTPAEKLGSGGPPAGLLPWLEANAAPGEVFCVSGEVLRSVLTDVRRRGVALEERDEGVLLAEGVVWELRLSPLALTAHTALRAICGHQV